MQLSHTVSQQVHLRKDDSKVITQSCEISYLQQR